MFRKLYHLTGLLFPIILILFSRKLAVYSSGFLFIIILLFDMFRLQYKEFNLLIIKRLPIKLKRKEVKSLSGSPFFLGGCFFTLLLFKPDYAIGGIVYLSIGDMLAVLIGTRFGKIKIFGKTLEGALAFAFSTTAVMIIINNFGIVDLNTHSIFIGAVLCAILELLPIKVDDNLTIPIIGAFLLQILN